MLKNSSIGDFFFPNVGINMNMKNFKSVFSAISLKRQCFYAFVYSSSVKDVQLQKGSYP